MANRKFGDPRRTMFQERKASEGRHPESGTARSSRGSQKPRAMAAVPECKQVEVLPLVVDFHQEVLAWVGRVGMEWW